MIDEFELKKLNTMTAFLKAESESFSEDTIIFIECLIGRYNLVAALSEEIKIEDIPDEILDIIREGRAPNVEDLVPLDSYAQTYLISQLIWICGIGRIIYYSDESKAEEIIKMQEHSGAHFWASYIYSAFALLNCRVISDEFMAIMTNNYDNSTQNVLRLNRIFIELCECIYLRHHEDLHYYDLKADGSESG
jgi:hypothetical protein